MAKGDGWRMWDVREIIDRIEMERVGRGARRCGIRSVERGCVEGIGSCVEAKYCGMCGNRCGRGIVGRDESYRYGGRLEAKESGAVYRG